MAIAITTTNLFPTATKGVPYNYIVEGTSDAPGSLVQVFFEEMPYNLTFDDSFVDNFGYWFVTLSGIPSDAIGAYSGDITAYDEEGDSGGQLYVIVVQAAPSNCPCSKAAQPCPCSKCATTKCPPVQVVSGRGFSS